MQVFTYVAVSTISHIKSHSLLFELSELVAITGSQQFDDCILVSREHNDVSVDPANQADSHEGSHV